MLCLLGGRGEPNSPAMMLCIGGLLWCRALHLDEAKRVKDVSVMTQAQTSWIEYYRPNAAGHDASNTTAYYFLPKIQMPKYKSQ